MSVLPKYVQYIESEVDFNPIDPIEDDSEQFVNRDADNPQSGNDILAEAANNGEEFNLLISEYLNQDDESGFNFDSDIHDVPKGVMEDFALRCLNKLDVHNLVMVMTSGFELDYDFLSKLTPYQVSLVMSLWSQLLVGVFLTPVEEELLLIKKSLANVITNDMLYNDDYITRPTPKSVEI